MMYWATTVPLLSIKASSDTIKITIVSYIIDTRTKSAYSITDFYIISNEETNPNIYDIYTPAYPNNNILQ